MSPNSNQPIGIFDSGVGGLTVVAELIRRLPYEDIVYFGDVIRTPYGGRPKETIVRFACQDTGFLLEHNVKYIIVACNSASAMALDKLKSQFDIGISGVIEPGAAAAAAGSKNGRIGIIGTRATISSDSYARAIHRLDKKIKVFSLACPLFVPLAEEGYINKKATRLIAEDYLKSLKDLNIDTLVLGCTHYPLLKDIIGDVMGAEVKLIDSAGSTANNIAEILKAKKLLKDSTGNAVHKFYVSDVPDKFREVAERFLGQRIENITRINITKY
jgi:glutamate racemase